MSFLIYNFQRLWGQLPPHLRGELENRLLEYWKIGYWRIGISSTFSSGKSATLILSIRKSATHNLNIGKSAIVALEIRLLFLIRLEIRLQLKLEH